MNKKIEKNYVQYRDENTVYVNGKSVSLEKFTSNLEKEIRKGRCSSFNASRNGYSYQLLDTIYTYSNYEVEIGANADSDLNIEMNRLYTLANSKPMKKRYAKRKKDMYTKPKHIILRNLVDSVVSPAGAITFIVPTYYLISLVALTVGFTALGAILGNSVLFLPGLFKITGVLNYAVVGAAALGALYIAARTGIKSVKEIIDNENYPYEEREAERARIKKEQEEKVKKQEIEVAKKCEVTRTQNINKNNTINKKYEPVMSQDEKNIISYLGQQYRELEKERNKLIVTGGNATRIKELANEMNAIVYKVNSMMELDNSVYTSSGPVRKLSK